MGAQKDRVTSFLDLGAAFGIQAPKTPVVKTDTEAFYLQPLLRRLQLCDDVRGRTAVRHDRRERKVATIGDVLKTDKEARDKLGIRVIVIGALDRDEKIITEEPTTSSAKVSVLYPSNFDARPRMVNCSDTLLTEQEGISLDTIVGNADEIRQETAATRQDRLRMNIKSLDTLISIQKRRSSTQRYSLDFAPLQKQVQTRSVTGEMERLNRLKTIAVYDFLSTSLEVEAGNPHLQPLFTLTGNGTHVSLTMWSSSDKNVLQQMVDHNVPMLLEDGGTSYSTNISLESLRSSYQQFDQEQGDSLPHVIAGHHTMELLLQSSIRERRRQSDERIRATRSTTVKEIIPDLTDFRSLPVTGQLEKALDDVTVRSTDKLARNTANLERNTAIKNALEMPLEDRRRAGIDVVVIAPLSKSGTLIIDDPECTEYSVYVTFDSHGRKKFVNTRRASLAGVNVNGAGVQAEDLVALDAIIQQEPKLVDETVVDTYTRRLNESFLIGMEMKRLSGERKGSPDADVNTLLDITKRIEDLGEKRTIVALSAWELADIIEAKHPVKNLVSATAQTQHEITVIAINYQEVATQNMLAWLLRPGVERRFGESKRSQDIWLTGSRLRDMVAAFDRDETEANGAAILIAEKLQGIGIEI